MPGVGCHPAARTPSGAWGLEPRSSQLAARTHRATLTTHPDGLAFWVSLSVGMEKPRRLT